MTNGAEIKTKQKQITSKATTTEKEGGRGGESLLRFDFCFNMFKTEN